MKQAAIRHLFYFLLAIYFFSSVEAAANDSISTKDDPGKNPIAVIGHAGSGFLYPILPFNPLPPNSVASFEKSLIKNGADGVEIDVQMSRDNKFIVTHDADLSAIKDVDGCVSEHNAEDIIGKRYNSGFFYNLFHSEKVLSLEDFLAWFSSLEGEAELHLDLKNFDACDGGRPERTKIFAEELYRLMSDSGIDPQKVVWGGSDKSLLLYLQQLNPDLKIMLDTNSDFESEMHWSLEHKLAGMVIGRDVASREQAEGLEIILFGGRSKKTIRKFIEMQPNAIQVNNVKALRSLLH